MHSQYLNFILVACLCIMHISAGPISREKNTIHQKTAEDTNDRYFQEGDAIDLTCEAEGTYQASFHWLFKRNYIEQGPLDMVAENLMSSPIRHDKLDISSNLYIAHAKPEHSGKYTCVADSISHRVATSYNVIVQPSTGKPTAAAEEVAASDELRIYEWTTSIIQEEESSMYAVCRATQGMAKRPPTIKWTIGDKPVVENHNIKIHSNGDLEVAKVSDDFHFWNGELTCHAYSDDGKQVVSKGTFVYIESLEKN